MAKTKSGPKASEVAAVSESEPVKAEATFTKGQLATSKHFQHRRDVLQAVLEDDKRYTIKQAHALIDDFFGKKVE